MAAISSDEGNYSRDASFSSYLDTAERDFVQNLVLQSMHSFSPVYTPSRESISSLGSATRRSHRGPDGQLSVFGDERHFGEKADKPNIERDPRTGKNRRMKQKICSPDFGKYSEGSSWSSQNSSLFPRVVKSRNNSPSGKLVKLVPFGSRVFSSLQCKGSCLDVEPHNLVKHPSQILVASSGRSKSINSDANFTFPVLNSKIISKKRMEEEEEEEKHKKEQRKDDDIEVFKLHKNWNQKDKIVQNLERKLSVLTWDAIPRAVKREEDEETQSNASSELFEIPVFPATMMSSIAVQCGNDMSKDTKRVNEEKDEWEEVVSRIRTSLGGYSSTKASDQRKYGHLWW